MSELDAVKIKNPTNEDFTWRYNGEPYMVKANEEKSFAKYVAFHLAKHLSSKMINDAITPDERKDPARSLEFAHRQVYDNQHRRIALYKILGDKSLVEEVIKAYPFKGFVGEMKEYQDFVTSMEVQASTPSSPSTS